MKEHQAHCVNNKPIRSGERAASDCVMRQAGLLYCRTVGDHLILKGPID